MMSKEEFMALCSVVGYVESSEQSHYEEWVAEGKDPKTHVYHDTQILKHYIAGLLSTGSDPK